MKKLLLFLFLASMAWGQGSNKPTIIPFPGVPTGTCQPAQIAVNSATGDLYDCVAGTWTLVGHGGGGGTANIAHTTNVIKGDNAGNGIASTIVDDGTNPTQLPNGADTGVNGNLFTVTDSTGVVGKALCLSGGVGVICPANTTTGILGVVVYIAGGLDHYCWSRCNALWDNQTVVGDSGYIGSTAGEFHDSGNQFDTSGVQNVYVNSLNAGAGTAALTSVLTPDQVAGGSISSGGGIQNPVVVAGTGGVTVNLLAAQDATDPARWVLPVSGNCGLGFAKTTATVGNKFVLEAIPGQIYTAVADGTITAQHVLIGGTATPGRVKDSGAAQATGVSVGTCFMAKALAGATVGQTLPVLYLGLKFGVSGTATYTGSLTAGDMATWTGTGGQAHDLGHFNDNATTMTITESITPLVAAGANLGTAPLPFGDAYFGGAANHSFHFDTSAVASNVAVGIPNAASNTVQGIADPSDTQRLYYIGTDGIQHRAASTKTISFELGFPGNGTALTAAPIAYISLPFGCTITGWGIIVDAGTATVKFLKVAAGTAIPTVGSNSINTSGVAISTGTVIQSTTVTDFTTTTITANDILGAQLVTTSGVGYINAQLVCQ